MRELLYKVFVEDLLLKAIALLIAIGLTVVVRTALQTDAGLYVKVQYTRPTGRIIVSEPEQQANQVKVLVQGPWGKVRQASSARIEPIRVNLDQYSDGEMRFLPEMVSLPEGIRVQGFDPPSVYLHFEPEAKMPMPVQLTIEGEPAEGYRIKKSTLSPHTVRVRGPQNVVETMHNLRTRPLNVSNFTGTATVTVDLSPLPNKVEFVDHPAPRINVELVVEQFERRLANVPVRTTGQAQNVSINPPVATVVLRGQGLEKLQEVPTLVVDTTAEERKPAGNTYVKRLQITNLPPGIAYEITPSQVEFTVLKLPQPSPEPPRKQP